MTSLVCRGREWPMRKCIYSYPATTFLSGADTTLGCYRECAGKKVVRCVRVAPCALPIAWLERSARLWRLDTNQRVLRRGATGVRGGLRVVKSLRAPQGARYQPAGRGAPWPREPPRACSQYTSSLERECSACFPVIA